MYNLRWKGNVPPFYSFPFVRYRLFVTVLLVSITQVRTYGCVGVPLHASGHLIPPDTQASRAAKRLDPLFSLMSHQRAELLSIGPGSTVDPACLALG